MNIFVGNLASAVTENDLKAAFGGHGIVLNVVLIQDPATNKHRGYGHVFIAPDAAARAAIAELNGLPLKGQRIAVRECIYRAADQHRDRQAGGPERPSHSKPERRGRGSPMPVRLMGKTLFQP